LRLTVDCYFGDESQHHGDGMKIMPRKLPFLLLWTLMMSPFGLELLEE
jgi:hypothetical protein